MNLQVPISTRSIIFKIGTTHLKELLDDDGLTLKMENRRINYQDLERRRTTTTDRQKENCGNSKLYCNFGISSELSSFNSDSTVML